MRLFVLFYTGLIFFSCSRPEKATEPFPVLPEGNGWIAYEGRVPLSEKNNLYIEISMLPDDQPGEGEFQLQETMEEGEQFITLSRLRGKYSVTNGLQPDELIIRFHNTALIPGVKRAYYSTNPVTTPAQRVIIEEYFRKTDLMLKRVDDNFLLVLDRNLEPLSTSIRHNLVKRTSRLFTVEGYFTHNGDSATFLEMNTDQRWAVSKLGAYDQAIRQYHMLAKDKLEGIYLKGTGYSVHQINQAGKEVDALVFKKIIQMSSAPTIE